MSPRIPSSPCLIHLLPCILQFPYHLLIDHLYNASQGGLDSHGGMEQEQGPKQEEVSRVPGLPSSHDATVVEGHKCDNRSSNSSSATRARDTQMCDDDAVEGLNNMVAGMSFFVKDSRAGPEGAEVEAMGGNVQFDVDKFMRLLEGEDLRLDFQA